MERSFIPLGQPDHTTVFILPSQIGRAMNHSERRLFSHLETGIEIRGRWQGIYVIRLGPRHELTEEHQQQSVRQTIGAVAHPIGRVPFTPLGIVSP